MTGNRLQSFWRGFRRQLGRVALAAVLVIIVAYVLNWPTNYLILRPGQALDVGPMISVDGQAGEAEGLLMTTVLTHQARLWLAVVGVVHPGIDMFHISNILRPGQTVEEYYRQNQWLMKDSQALAITLALQQLGYPAYTAGDGALVTYVLPDAPAHGVLKVGDIITVVEGVEVATGDELLDRLKPIAAGDIVSLQYLRDQGQEEVTLDSRPHPEDATRAYIGITVLTAEPEVVGPAQVEIDAGDVGGPSAGLMFTLEIIGRFEPEFLPPDVVIAGTGILDRHGNVGPVGGVRQKVKAAEEAGADVFLVPVDNYEAAARAASTARVVAVRNLDEAIEIVSALDKAS